MIPNIAIATLTVFLFISLVLLFKESERSDKLKKELYQKRYELTRCQQAAERVRKC